jgi:hypothetical protein
VSGVEQVAGRKERVINLEPLLSFSPLPTNFSANRDDASFLRSIHPITLIMLDKEKAATTEAGYEVEDSVKVKKAVRKMDSIVLSLCAIIYLLNFLEYLPTLLCRSLDRANLLF